METLEAKKVDQSSLPLGLTSSQVQEQITLGNINVSKGNVGKSYLRIVCDNLFTFFNMVWAIVAFVLAAFGSYTNLTFIPIILPNILIGLFSEIKAKQTVEKLSVTTEPMAVVIRDGVEQEIAVTDIVLGDVMKIELGKQVLSDAVVISGYAEANESMLTGESDAIKKSEGDTVLAGSFLVSGSIYVRVIRVGKDNYVHKIESAAKSFKAPASNLFRDLNRLIKFIGILMIPIAVALFATNWIAYGGNLTVTVTKTSGSIIGMIPAGAYLLVTLTLTLSVIKLARKRTLVQDMYSIEMLAAADVVCLDKTGTITDGTMCVSEFKSLNGTNEGEIRRIMAMLEGSEDSINNTSRALIDFFGTEKANIIEKVPFSSARKYSAVSIEGEGCFAIGAPHFVPCPVSAELEDEIRRHASLGERVLLLTKLPSLDAEGYAVAIIAISDRIRPSAAETIAKFQDQGVTVKIISGDHAATVSTIATRVGVKNADKYISCENLSDDELCAVADEYAIFGRVTPEQKVLLVKKLKSEGHIVAMTGDGVNDTLALKESNCAIAMADGSEVARKIAQIVLMDSDFSTLPDVVREGRRCINNVRASSTLFLMKTLFTLCLSLFAICTVSGYPFEPKQFMLLEMFVIGLASFMLALEPNNKRIEGSFLKTVLIKSLPYALVMFLPTLILILLDRFKLVYMSGDSRNSMAMLIVTVTGFINLFSLCRPFTKWRVGVCCSVVVGFFIIGPVSIYLNDLVHILPAFENPLLFFCVLGASIVIAVIIHLFLPNIERAIYRITDNIYTKFKERKANKQNTK